MCSPFGPGVCPVASQRRSWVRRVPVRKTVDRFKWLYVASASLLTLRINRMCRFRAMSNHSPSAHKCVAVVERTLSRYGSHFRPLKSTSDQ